LKIPRLSAQAGILSRIHNRREHIARLTAAVDDKPPPACDQRVENFVTGQSPAERVASAAGMGQMRETNK
jgi:hypothetical protein